MNDMERVDKAWDQVMSVLASLTAKVRDSELSCDHKDRAEAYRMIMALATNAYTNVVYPDPRTPELMDDYSILLNYCGPTGDFKYTTVLLEEGGSYRVWGRRGSVHIIDFQQSKGWWEPGSLNPTVTIGHATLDESDITVESDGTFSFIFSSEEQPDNWLYRHPEASAVFVRQIFNDWERETPAEIHFERIEDISEEQREPDQAYRIEQAALSIKNLGRATFDLFPRILKEVGYHQICEQKWTSVGGQSNQNYFTAIYNLKDDEALVLEINVPDTCIYWSVQLYNVWWQALDYRNYQCSINGSQTMQDEDGTTRILISNSDIGVANWLDLASHLRGLIIIRCKHQHTTSSVSIPKLQVVRLTDGLSVLGEDTTSMISPEERQRQRKIRHRHLVQRFGR